ncbi:AraC family transcriptional regulator [Vibrio brasiliensis]|uniref:helix-turn-helix domain-containing protein n=1 Tax=Vibrio brasiliensis TaxID=170652 RepID=UPI001EFCA675|nr:AraC family transcriptional regulator [Vibrio brasiliensis]MCG9649311.1 AraC family transcriptional regulator [Vibrio brasiliensis]
MKIDKSANFKQSTVLPWVELRIANQSTACYEAHSHDEFSFGIIQQGRADYRNHQATHHIGKGDIVTINPADVHSCNPEAGTWSYSMLFVDTKQMGQIQQEILSQHHSGYCDDYAPFRNPLERDPHIRQHYLALFNSLQQEASQLQVESRLYDFIERAFSEVLTNSKQAPSSQLKRVQEKLLDDVSYAHQLDQLAQEAQMSRYQLLRAFKHHYGLPPHAYLMDEKIKRAKVMLKSGQEIADVALELGFSDQAHFQRQFKKKIAVTPKFYQSHFVD